MRDWRGGALPSGLRSELQLDDWDQWDEQLSGPLAAERVRQRGATTLMLRNMPNMLTSNELVGVLEALGFAGSFDLCFVPIDRISHNCKGYAFVNFDRPEQAAQLCLVAESMRFSRGAAKRTQVSIAHTQGSLATLERIAPATKKRRSNGPAAARDGVCVRVDSGMQGMTAAEALALLRRNQSGAG